MPCLCFSRVLMSCGGGGGEGEREEGVREDGGRRTGEGKKGEWRKKGGKGRLKKCRRTFIKERC